VASAETATGTWNAVQCNTALTAWYASHPHSSQNETRAYKATLREQHGCFTAASHEPEAAPSHSWNSVQCSRALEMWYKGHRGAGLKEARAYKATLREQHGCFTASSVIGPG